MLSSARHWCVYAYVVQGSWVWECGEKVEEADRGIRGVTWGRRLFLTWIEEGVCEDAGAVSI